jgi:hypothetical protein
MRPSNPHWCRFSSHALAIHDPVLPLQRKKPLDRMSLPCIVAAIAIHRRKPDRD